MDIIQFINNEILGMKWLERLTGYILEQIGVDLTNNIGQTIHFFTYDVIKIVILLCVLIFLISYIQSYFPPERTKKYWIKYQELREILLQHCLVL